MDQEKDDNRFRKSAELLWELLDDIESASDLFRPKTLEDHKRFQLFLQKKLQKRFTVFRSDGEKCYTKEEWASKQQEETDGIKDWLDNQDKPTIRIKERKDTPS